MTQVTECRKKVHTQAKMTTCITNNNQIILEEEEEL
jgi:hypothetical protein